MTVVCLLAVIVSAPLHIHVADSMNQGVDKARVEIREPTPRRRIIDMGTTQKGKVTLDVDPQIKMVIVNIYADGFISHLNGIEWTDTPDPNGYKFTIKRIRR